MKSIRLTPDGFSLYYLHDNNDMRHVFHPAKENALITNEAPDFFKMDAASKKPLDIIIATHVPMLIPDVVFVKDKAKDYLQLQFDVAQFGESFDEILGRYRSLSFLTQNECSTLNELPCIPVFKSEVSIMYDFLKQQEENDAVMISINDSFADILAVQKGEPVLVNRTRHVENVDILYYTINCMQQMGLSSPTLFVQYFSKPNKKLNELLAQYLDNIIIL